MAEFLSESKI
jgi:hypothetical protein